VVVKVSVFLPLTDPEVELTVSQAGRVVVSTLKNALGILVEPTVTVALAGTPEPTMYDRVGALGELVKGVNGTDCIVTGMTL